MEWKPKGWIAGLLGLFVTPFGMLYVQRPRLALAYFCASFAIAIGLFVVNPVSVTGSLVGSLLGWAVSIACAIHAYRIARQSAPLTNRAWYSRWYGLFGTTVAVVLLVFSVRAFLFEPFRIPSESMYPTLPEGSIVMADKRGFGHYGTYGIEPFKSESTATIARGDLVIFRLVDQPETSYLKRVVAIAGDHIEYRDRRMTLNGQPVSISFGEKSGPYQLATEVLEGRTITIAFMLERPSRDYDAIVPANHFVVFGDSRDNARDSRYLGMVDRQAIVGRVVKVF